MIFLSCAERGMSCAYGEREIERYQEISIEIKRDRERDREIERDRERDR